MEDDDAVIKVYKSNKETIRPPSEVAKVAYDKANRLYKNNTESTIEMERMLQECSKATVFEPGVFKHYVLLGNIYRKSMDMASAIYAYRFALTLDQNNFGLKRFLARTLAQHGQEILYMAATQLIQKRIALKVKLSNSNIVYSETTTNAAAATRLVNDNDCTDFYAEEMALFLKALERFNESIKLENDQYQVWIYKCQCHVRLSQFADALASVSRAIHHCPHDNNELYILRGKLYWAQGLMDEGNMDIRAGCSLDPNHVEIKDYIARSYAKAEMLYQNSLRCFGEKNYSGALFSVQHALSVSQDDIKLHYMLAKVYRMMGKLNEAYSSIQFAANIFREANDISKLLPEDISNETNYILNELALKFMTDGDYKKAIVLYNRIIESEKNIRKSLFDIDYRYYYNRGDCYRAIGKYTEAIAEYSSALTISKNDWGIKLRISLSYYMMALDFFNVKNDFIEADKAFGKAIQYNPKVSEYYVARGRNRYHLGNFPGAYADYTAALELNPKNEMIAEAIKQFNAHGRGMVKDAWKKIDNDELGGVDDLVSEKMEVPAVDSRENGNATEGGVPIKPVRVCSKHMVETLLNPIDARKLPEVIQQRKAAMLPQVENKPRLFDEFIALQDVNPLLTNAIIARDKTLEVRANSTKVIEMKVDTTSKGPLFCLLDTAKENARSLQAAKLTKEQEEEIRKNKLITVSKLGLFKISADKTKKAMENPEKLLGEVVVSYKSQPNLIIDTPVSGVRNSSGVKLTVPKKSRSKM